MMSKRFFMLMVMMALFFGAGTAYSGLRTSDQKVIRIAYANGYKDALEYAFKVDGAALDKLKNSRDQFKTQVLYAADAYVEKVSGLNR
ncbi:MAG: hypothetical protein R8J85_01010 [Mariprofundales bacterium]